jgi:hypothetical protein
MTTGSAAQVLQLVLSSEGMDTARSSASQRLVYGPTACDEYGEL